MDLYSILTFLLSIIYVILIAKSKKWGFLFAFLASLIWAYTDFVIYNLKFDGFLQIFYAIMAVYGWVKWSDRNKDTNITIQLSFKQRTFFLFMGIFLSLTLVPVMNAFTFTNLPYLDSVTTIFSIIATFLLIYKYIESWLILLVCNILYIYIYSIQEAYAYAFMMVIYSIMAVYGYFAWSRPKSMDYK